MIGDLLEASRLEAGGTSYQVGFHDPSEIVRSVLEELQPTAQERDRRLELAEDPAETRLLCDGERIREVVANLLGNALKFSPAGSRVQVGLTECRVAPAGLPESQAAAVSNENGPFLLLSVADEGIGVPDDHKTRIFDKFHQVAGRQRIHGQGVGLGLAISRRIVGAHGGAIWVEDRPGGGSIFFVLLPAKPSRWRDIEDMDEEGAKVSARARTQADGSERGRVASRAMLALVLLCVVPSCALIGGGSGGTETPDPPESVGVAPPEEPAPEPPPAWSVRLNRARALLADGSFTEAAGEFEAALRLGAEGAARTEAHWGLALVYLSPESSLRNRTTAATHLDIVEHEATDGLVQAQAAWARAMLGQIAQLEGQVRERDEMLRQLNEALEMLRRIDLDRRPSGGAAPGAPPGDARP